MSFSNLRSSLVLTTFPTLLCLEAGVDRLLFLSRFWRELTRIFDSFKSVFMGVIFFLSYFCVHSQYILYTLQGKARIIDLRRCPSGHIATPWQHPSPWWNAHPSPSESWTDIDLHLSIFVTFSDTNG